MFGRIGLAALLAGAGFVPVLAQSQVLPSTALMREQAQATYRTLNRMVRGEDPYDQAKVDAALATLTETSAKIAGAFPESSKGQSTADSRFSASPKVWEQKAEFNADIAKLQAAVKNGHDKSKSLDDLKAAYPGIADACNACHETFRLRKS